MHTQQVKHTPSRMKQATTARAQNDGSNQTPRQKTYEQHLEILRKTPRSWGGDDKRSVPGSNNRYFNPLIYQHGEPIKNESWVVDSSIAWPRFHIERTFAVIHIELTIIVGMVTSQPWHHNYCMPVAGVVCKDSKGKKNKHVVYGEIKTTPIRYNTGYLIITSMHNYRPKLCSFLIWGEGALR